MNKVLIEWSSEELWATLCDRIMLSGQISKSGYYQSFLEQVYLKSFDQGHVVLEVKNELIQGFLTQNLKEALVTEFAVLLKCPVDLVVEVNEALSKHVVLDSSGDTFSKNGMDQSRETDFHSTNLSLTNPSLTNSSSTNSTLSEPLSVQSLSEKSQQADSHKMDSNLYRFAPVESLAKPQPASLTLARAESKLNPHLNFEKFVTGNSNHNVYNTALNVANDPGNQVTNPLVIYGSTGLGKTHLLHAIGNHSFECETAKKVIYITSEQFLNHFVSSVKLGTLTPLAKYADFDLLMIDDIQFIARGEETQVHLVELMSLLVQRGKQVVVTCDKYPHEVRGDKNKKFHSDLLKRFEDGFVVDVDRPDQVTRLEILKQKAKQAAGRKDYFPLEVLKFVSERYTSNVRELEGIILKLFAYKNMLGREISLDVARVVLGDVRRNSSRKFTLNDIINEVSTSFGVPVSTIVSQSRKADVMVARKVAMYLARALTDNSLHTIGVQFNRDYSSVQYCVRALMKSLAKDPELNSKVESLREKLRDAQ